MFATIRRRPKTLTGLAIGVFLLAVSGSAGAQVGCDIIVCDLYDLGSYGTQNGIYAYAVGTNSANIGDQICQWQSGNNQHPVIGQEMFRLKDGVLEQIGISFLKHGFCALSQTVCTGSCQSTSCSTLGVGCSDPYSAGLNGQQSNLGPRSQVNAHTGFYPFPYSTPGGSGTIFRRLQVHGTDLEPNDPSIRYYVSSQYITADEANFGSMTNDDNNCSYRRVNVSNNANRSLTFVGGNPTQQQSPGIQAWQDNVPAVTIVEGRVDGEGLFLIAYNVTDNGNGTWHYEYAIFNMNSDRSGQSWSIPVPGGVAITNLGFHDVDYHSGDGVNGVAHSGTDWAAVNNGSTITWSCTPWASNTNANALRWSTMYNFRFDANSPPQAAVGELGLFKPGSAGNVLVDLLGPSGDFLDPVEGLTCVQTQPNSQAITLGWTNPISYTSIVVRRDGTEVATLPGTMTSYVDPAPPLGLNNYTVQGIQGTESAAQIACDVDVLPPPPPTFTFHVDDTVGSYDPANGVGGAVTAIHITEDPGNAGFPHAASGFSVGLANDANLLNPFEVLEGSNVSSLTPDFFSASIYDNAVAIGIVFDFFGVIELLLDSSNELAVVSYETTGSLAGNMTGASSVLTFETITAGTLPIENLVVIGTEPHTPNFDHGTVDLIPGGSTPQFVRGDVNGDGSVNLADAIAALQFLFSNGNIPCEDAADINDDGTVNIADGVNVLSYLFSGGQEPASPFPGCGSDPTADSIECDSFPVCL
ncbi:MAG TPA: hypothetical protein EYN00_04250 [Planctomycetes bacterium]|nr:hypothetical protein [Planctomycetota bacterium]